MGPVVAGRRHTGRKPGLSALNFADILGADPIYLVGYDLQPIHGKTGNWHREYPDNWKMGAWVYAKMIERFRDFAPCARHRVVNLNPRSALDCFPVLSPEEVWKTQLSS